MMHKYPSRFRGKGCRLICESLSIRQTVLTTVAVVRESIVHHSAYRRSLPPLQPPPDRARAFKLEQFSTNLSLLACREVRLAGYSERFWKETRTRIPLVAGAEQFG